MVVDETRLRRLLGGADTRWLIDRLRERLERDQPLDGILVLHQPTEGQRASAERMLGRRPGRGASLTVPVADLDAVMRSSGCAACLAEAVVTLTGPLTRRAAGVAQAEQAWERAHAVADPLIAARPVLSGWPERLRTTGVLRRACRDPDEARGLMARAVAVLGALPTDGTPLAVLAVRTCHDAHALDPDRPLSGLVLPAVARIAGIPTEPSAASRAEWRREVWAAVGVLVTDLAGPVLTIGLPGDTAGATGLALAAWREAGQPVHLSLRQLVRDPPGLDLGGQTVSVCENTAVVAAAADRLGTRAGPLVCVAGRPGAAAHALLRLLAERGARLRYHGDFDWGGLAIADGVIRRFGATAWQYDAASYYTAAARGGRPLPDRPYRASWDPALTVAMQRVGVCVEEEAVVDELLPDIAE